MAFMPILMHAQAISLPSDTVNCGQVVYKHPVKAEFKMKNSGDKPLVISDVKTSCGCTTVSYPSVAIAPGKTFTVSAVYDAKTMGHFQKEVGIYSNASDKPLLLTIRGEVVAKKSNFKGEYPYTLGDMLVDKAEILFDNVNRGDMPIQQVHILNNSDETMEPQLMHLPPYLRGEVKPKRVAPGRSATVTLQVDSKQLGDLGLTQTGIYLGEFPGDKVAPERSWMSTSSLSRVLSNRRKSSWMPLPASSSPRAVSISVRLAENRRRKMTSRSRISESRLSPSVRCRSSARVLRCR